jgi:hypothetical protein
LELRPIRVCRRDADASDAMNFLLYYSIFTQFGFILLIFGGGSVAGLYLVRMIVGVDTLRADHEVGGVTFGVLGAFYGLILAFVIVAAWERYDRANERAHNEAVSLESLYKLGSTFSDPMRTNITGAVREYTLRVVNEEFPAMAVERFQLGTEGAHRLWQLVLAYQAPNEKEAMLVDKSIDQLNSISESRSLRYLYYSSDLPPVVWTVIYLGCVITIGFSYFFGSTSFAGQALMCATFAVLLGLTILAVLELAHPYQGSIAISDSPFRYSLSRSRR